MTNINPITPFTPTNEINNFNGNNNITIISGEDEKYNNITKINKIINQEIGNNNLNYIKPEEDGKTIKGNNNDNSFNIERYNSISSENNNFAPPPIADNFGVNNK